MNSQEGTVTTEPPLSTETIGRYTIHADPLVDARIEKDLDRIVEETCRRFPDTEAVILVGGFGRGEGAVLFEDDGPRPLNDYDLVHITTKRADTKAINVLREDLAKELGIDWVDIVNYPRHKIPKLACSQFNYDFAKSGMLLFGDAAILEEIPQWEASDISLADVEKLLFTRVWCFLGGYRLEFENSSLDEDETFFLYQQLAKAILAVQDAQLLTIGAYDPSYRVRAERYRQEFPEQAVTFDLFDLANRAKLAPVKHPPVDPMSIFGRARDLYLDAFAMLGYAKYERRIDDSFDYETAYLRAYGNRINRLKGTLKRNPYHRRTQAVNAAQLHLLFAHERIAMAFAQGEDAITPEMLRARSLLRSLDPKTPMPLDWDRLRAEAARLRMDV